MKRRLFVLWLALCSGAAVAGDILDQVRALLNPAEIAQGRFRQEKQLAFLNKPLLSEGEFVYWQRGGVIWKTLTPVVSTVLVGDERMLSDQGEQTMPPSFGRLIPALLGGDLARLREDFAVSGDVKDRRWRLQFVPKDPVVAKAIAEVVLSGDNDLRGLDIREVEGNQSRIAFDNISHPSQLTPEQAAEFERLSP